MTERLSRGHFCGSLLGKHETSGLTLTEYVYPAGLRLSKHQHESSYFCVVLQGGYDEKFDTRDRVCGPSTVTFHPNGEYHSDGFHPNGARIFSLEIGSIWRSRVGTFAKLLDDPAEFHGGVLSALLTRMYREFRFMDDASLLAIEGIALEIVAEASRCKRSHDKTPPRWLKNAREFVDAHAVDRLTLDVIADQAGVHPVHLAREFRKHYRQTIGEYIRMRRIEYACDKLSSTETPLIEIALNAGFAQQSHFSSAFRRVTGMTPTTYRTNTRAMR